MSKLDSHGDNVAVFGASGHTGCFVVDELERRGLRAIRIGRDSEKLQATSDAASREPARLAHVDDEESLDAALAGAALVINCAGTFLDTALPVIDAALRAGIPYLDVAPEQVVVQSVFATRQDAASAAGVPVLPAAAFYGGLADLLASALVGDADHIDTITVGVGLDSWHPTIGTRLTGQRNTTPRVVQRQGRLEEVGTPAETGLWSFQAPIGQREVVVMPLSEVITLASHLKADSIESWMNVEPLRDLSDISTPPPEPIDGIGRSSQRFVMDVVVDVGGEHRCASASGCDIYQVTAPIVVEAAQRLLAGDAKLAGGVHALGAIFDAPSFLSALGAGTMDISSTTLSHPLLEKDRNHAHRE